MKNQFTTFFSLFFLLLYPLFKFIWFQRYPFLSLEVLTMTAAFLVLAILVGLISKKPAWLAFWFGIAFYIIITTGPTYVSPVSLIIRGTIALLIMVGLMLSKQKLITFVTIGLLGILATDLVMGLPQLPEFDADTQLAPQNNPAQQLASNPTQKQHTLIIVFDEHIGLDGLPTAQQETSQLKKNLTDFYLQNNFTIYPEAYSNYYYTEDSIPNALNNTHRDTRYAYFPDRDKSRPTTALGDNALFDLSRKNKQDTQVYQSTFLDYCPDEQPVTSCFVYPHNWLRAVLDIYPFSSRLRVVFSQFIMTNSFVRETNGGRLSHRWLITRTGPLKTFPAVLNRIQRDMVNAQKSTLFFAHLLMPHYPYVYDESCRPRPLSEWKNNDDKNERKAGRLELAMRDRYSLYAGQDMCLINFLGDFFDGLKKAGLYDSTQIIFFGDHGSRIMLDEQPTLETIAQFSEQQIENAFSALFAAKQRYADKGHINTAHNNIVDLLWSSLNGEMVTSSKERPYAFIKTNRKAKEMIPVPLPAFR